MWWYSLCSSSPSSLSLDSSCTRDPWWRSASSPTRPTWAFPRTRRQGKRRSTSTTSTTPVGVCLVVVVGSLAFVVLAGIHIFVYMFCMPNVCFNDILRVFSLLMLGQVEKNEIRLETICLLSGLWCKMPFQFEDNTVWMRETILCSLFEWH